MLLHTLNDLVFACILVKRLDPIPSCSDWYVWHLWYCKWISWGKHWNHHHFLTSFPDSSLAFGCTLLQRSLGTWQTFSLLNCIHVYIAVSGAECVVSSFPVACWTLCWPDGQWTQTCCHSNLLFSTYTITSCTPHSGSW